MNRLQKVFFMCVLVGLTACVSAGKMWPDQSGVVLDEQTQQPIEGAIVVARWIGRISQIVDSQTTCYHVESTTTDKQGIYQISAWTKPPGKVHHNEIAITVYRSGYIEDFKDVKYKAGTFYERVNADVVYMKRDSRSVKERLEYLQSTSYAGMCGSERNRRDQLLPFYDALYQEAITITKSTTDNAKFQTTLDSLENSLSVVKYGWDHVNRAEMARYQALERERNKSIVIKPDETGDRMIGPDELR